VVFFNCAPGASNGYCLRQDSKDGAKDFQQKI